MTRQHGRLLAIALACLVLSAGSSTAQNAAPPPKPVPFAKALEKVAKELVETAGIGPGETRELVIDPLIDAKSGSETASTRSMEAVLVAALGESLPNVKVIPFTQEALKRKPLLLIGSLTPINAKGEAGQKSDVYSVWVKVADLGTGNVIGSGKARVTPASVDARPVGLGADAPAFAKDAATDAYITSCAKIPPGQPLDPVYVRSLDVAALVKSANAAYEAGDYEQALIGYRQAAASPAGNQLRVFNGIYLSNVKLNRPEDAEVAFKDVVKYGLENDKLGVKFLFKVGETDFIGDDALTNPYPMWIRQVAAVASQSGHCLEVVGNTSRSGAELRNIELSQLRAGRIRDMLTNAEPTVAPKLKISGVGWKANIIGTGADDFTDALDRRVDFRVGDTTCS